MSIEAVMPTNCLERGLDLFTFDPQADSGIIDVSALGDFTCRVYRDFFHAVIFTYRGYRDNPNTPIFSTNRDCLAYCAISATYVRMDNMSTTTETSWIPSTSAFGARLALVRWQMGWNVKEAAFACGLSESNWRGWEMDGRLPHKLNDVAGKIAKHSGANKYWLMDGEGQPSDYKAMGIRPVVKLSDRPRRRNDSRGPGSRAA